MTADPARVVVVVTPGCHLCDDACAVVDAVCSDLGVGWEARQLDDLEPDARHQWHDYVPVVLVDGQVHDVLRATEARLRTALS